MKKNKSLYDILLAISILMGFVFFASFIVFYVRENYGVSCNCSFSLNILIVLLSSLGVLVGSITYYLIDKKNIKEKSLFEKGINETLNFLDSDERLLINNLIENHGLITQSKLTSNLKFDKVKTFRLIKKLEKKNIIYRKDKGMTKDLYLNQYIKYIFK